MQIVPGATRVLIEKEDLSLDVIKQHKVLVQGDQQKADILKSYILRNADKLGQMIVFVRTRRAADMLTQVLCPSGFAFTCSAVPGNPGHVKAKARSDRAWYAQH
jgi:ATP-dependent RNA helicase DDX19/DBP5